MHSLQQYTTTKYIDTEPRCSSATLSYRFFPPLFACMLLSLPCEKPHNTTVFDLLHSYYLISQMVFFYKGKDVQGGGHFEMKEVMKRHCSQLRIIPN